MIPLDSQCGALGCAKGDLARDEGSFAPQTAVSHHNIHRGVVSALVIDFGTS